jgi:hypothetical protein
MEDGDLVRPTGRGPGLAFQWKPLAAWAVIILVIFAVVSLLDLPGRMGCRPSPFRRMACQHSLLSPETWANPRR